MKSHKMCAHSLYGELFRGGKVDRQSGRFSPRGWQENSVQMARLRRNIQRGLVFVKYLTKLPRIATSFVWEESWDCVGSYNRC